MAIAEIFTLTALGGNLIGWGLGKVCDKSILVGHAEIQKRLQNNGLDPNHDIERAVLTAHYKSLQFIVENTFSQEEDMRVETYSPRLEHSRGHQGFQRIFKAINEGDFKGLADDMAGDWQTVIPTSFETAQSLDDVQQTIPSSYVAQAKADLLSLAAWTEIEKEALAESADHPDLGWVTSFSACLREQIKINDAFRHIFFATNQQHQSVMLADIQEHLKTILKPSVELATAMGRIDAKLDGLGKAVAELPEKIQIIVDETMEKHGLSKNELTKLNEQITDLKIDRALTEDRIFKFLKIALPHLTVEKGHIRDNLSDLLDVVLNNQNEYLRQANIPSNDSNELRRLRKDVAQFLKDFETDKARAALKASRAKNKEKMEESARLEANYIIEEAKIETVDLNADQAMILYERAAETIIEYDKRQAIKCLNKGAEIGYDRGKLFGEGFLNRARALYQKSLYHVPYESDLPALGYETLWASTQHNLASVYLLKGVRGEHSALDKAIKTYEDALTVHTKDTAPIGWAMTQNNLANVYQIKGERGEDGALDKAIQAYESALTIYTKDTAPMDWAMTQNNLANVYSTKGERGEDGALDKAVQAYEDALTIYTKDNAPMDWAMTQNNLANVYRLKGKRGNDGALGKAIQAYEDALNIFTKDAAPIHWATTQNNLAIVYQITGERGEDGALDKAMLAYKDALTVRTKDTAPMSWAMTQNNLAIIYSVKGKRGEDGALDKAVQAYEDALTIRTKDAAPMDWAATQNNLGKAYSIKGERGEHAALDKAIQAYENALSIYTKDFAPMNWANTIDNLGDVYWTKGNMKKAEHFYREALLEYKKRKAVWQINNLEKWMIKCGFKV
jgi:tetratricopeptide (TPR) repeat protein